MIWHSSGWTLPSSGLPRTMCRSHMRRSWRISCCRRRVILYGQRGVWRSISVESQLATRDWRRSMARIDVIMPQMGESIAEGTLSRWMKKVGEQVQRDEPIFEISTDKVDAEIPAPGAGVLAEILVQEGQTVAVQTVVARIETDAGAAVAENKAPAAPPPAAPVPPKTATPSGAPP